MEPADLWLIARMIDGLHQIARQKSGSLSQKPHFTISWQMINLYTFPSSYLESFVLNVV